MERMYFGREMNSSRSQQQARRQQLSTLCVSLVLMPSSTSGHAQRCSKIMDSAAPLPHGACLPTCGYLLSPLLIFLTPSNLLPTSRRWMPPTPPTPASRPTCPTCWAAAMCCLLTWQRWVWMGRMFEQSQRELPSPEAQPQPCFLTAPACLPAFLPCRSSSRPTNSKAAAS